MTLEDELREVLAARAEMFEPSENAYLDLKRRVAAETHPIDPTQVGNRNGRNRGGRNRNSRTGWGSSGPRILAVAASLALLVGAAAFALQRQTDSEQVTADSGITTTASSSKEPAGSSDAQSEMAAEIVPDDPAVTQVYDVDPARLIGVQPAPAGVFGPPRASWQAAALDFLELLHLPSDRARLVPDGDLVQVFATSEDGSERAVTALKIASTTLNNGEDGFVVVRATSPEVTIDSPSVQQSIKKSSVVVSGEGTGFEATVGIRLYSADDGVLLDVAPAMAGNFGKLAPYEQRLSAAGRENAWVVAISTGGSDMGIEAFSAVAVKIDAPLPTDTHTVSGIPLDDPDGGLVVRDMPGTSEGQELLVLPSGLSDVRRRGVVSMVDGQAWWNIWLPAADTQSLDRKAGWVNSAYLTSGDPVGEASLREIANDFIGATKAGGVAFDQLPWSTRPIHVGWTRGLKVLSASGLNSTEAWDQDRDWLIPEERFSKKVETASLRSFVDSLAPDPVGNEFSYESVISVGVDPVATSPYGADQAELATRFAGTSWVQIADPGNGGSEWQTTTLFVESGADGPAIVGIVVTFWIP